ncbi:MAG: hypothetical protein CK427_08875 [Leptospira sp.]|nr:MAG: hypothetical protein CK427_08875 [Leptospira sp.]
MSYTILLLLAIFISLSVCSDGKKSKPIEKSEIQIDKDRCTLRPNPGPCKAMFPGYYYDHSKTSCQEFIYGGCQGSLPFKTLEACEKSCL